MKNIFRFLILIFCCIFISLPCWADDINEDDDESFGGISLTTKNPAKQKAQQVAARRGASLSKMMWIAEHPDDNSIYIRDNGDSSATVNLTTAYLFADECVYPFSTFNWPTIMTKEQLYSFVANALDCLDMSTVYLIYVIIIR